MTRALRVEFIVFLCLVLSAPALAHGPAAWIQQGQFKNKNGELCCGERDCRELRDEDVKVVEGGYYIIPLKELVPYSEATPSLDGHYWRCEWGGTRKCFFAPTNST